MHSHVEENMKRALGLIMISVLAVVTTASAQQLSLETSVRVPGNYLTPHKICANKRSIFSVTYQGNLYVQNDDRSSQYPIVYQAHLSDSPLTGVACDTRYVYVTGEDGLLRTIQRESPFAIVAVTSVTGSPLSDVNYVNRTLLVSQVHGSASATSDQAFLYEQNPGDSTLEVSRRDYSVQQTYGTTFEPGATVVYDLDTGDRLGSIPNPEGGTATSYRSYADDQYLFLMAPGCCGQGIWLYPMEALRTAFTTPPTPQYIPYYYTDSVARAGRWLVAGSEASAVAIFDLTKSPPQQVASINLLPFSGRTEIDAAEARDVQILSYNPEVRGSHEVADDAVGARGEHGSMTIMVGTSWTYPDTPSQYFLKFTW
jgi:hypothetical protein